MSHDDLHKYLLEQLHILKKAVEQIAEATGVEVDLGDADRNPPPGGPGEGHD